MFLKGNRQIRNSFSNDTNGNIKDYDDGNLGMCCFFPSHLLKAINSFIRQQSLQLDMYGECHCAGPLGLISNKQ